MYLGGSVRQGEGLGAQGRTLGDMYSEHQLKELKKEITVRFCIVLY